MRNATEQKRVEIVRLPKKREDILSNGQKVSAILALCASAVGGCLLSTDAYDNAPIETTSSTSTGTVTEMSSSGGGTKSEQGGSGGIGGMSGSGGEITGTGGETSTSGSGGGLGYNTVVDLSDGPGKIAIFDEKGNLVGASADDQKWMDLGKYQIDMQPGETLVTCRIVPYDDIGATDGTVLPGDSGFAVGVPKNIASINSAPNYQSFYDIMALNFSPVSDLDLSKNGFHYTFGAPQSDEVVCYNTTFTKP